MSINRLFSTTRPPLAMPFDTVTLNDGARVRISPSTPCPVSYQEPTVSDPCVWNWKQMERDCKPRDPLAVLVNLIMICRLCNPRTLQNTYCRPSRLASSTSTQLPVTYLPITPTGHWTQSQLSVYQTEESTGAGLRKSRLARSSVLSPVCLTGLTVRK